MIGDVFFDTNIICYAFNEADLEKRSICEKLLEEVLTGKKHGVLSNQVIVEFFNASTRKLGFPIEKSRKISKFLLLSGKWRKVNYNNRTLFRTFEKAEVLDVPFLDLLIAETMKENGITEIITENEKDFARISGIKVINPFKSQ